MLMDTRARHHYDTSLFLIPPLASSTCGRTWTERKTLRLFSWGGGGLFSSKTEIKLTGFFLCWWTQQKKRYGACYGDVVHQLRRITRAASKRGIAQDKREDRKVGEICEYTCELLLLLHDKRRGGSGAFVACRPAYPLSSSSKLGTGNISQQQDRRLEAIDATKAARETITWARKKHRN